MDKSALSRAMVYTVFDLNTAMCAKVFSKLLVKRVVKFYLLRTNLQEDKQGAE